MRIFTEKSFCNLTKPLTKNFRQTSAWLSARFGYKLMYYRSILRHPDDYLSWAENSAANDVIETFKELCEHDIDCAQMLYGSYCRDLWEMVRKTYGDDNPVDHFKFYYEKGGR